MTHVHEGFLFEDPDARVSIPLRDAELTFHEHAFSPRESDHYFASLMAATPWRHDHITIHGNSIPLPRLQAWYCEPPHALNYSGMRVPALPWTDELRSILARVTGLTGRAFNGVLVNCYRDGNDSVGWHRDNEAEWGENPVIASVSFGATRDFVLKHVSDRSLDPVTLPLSHGSLLVMGETVQNTWQHRLPKRRRVSGARINLTFRNLVCPG